MDFDLSPDQVALAEAAATFLADQCSTARVREVAAGADGFDRDLWRAMLDLGWLGVEQPEAEGGLGLGAVEVAVLVEALGGVTAPVPFVTSALALDVATRAGATDLVDGLARDGLVACVAWSRAPEAVRAHEGAGGWRLDGRPDPTPWASVSDVAIVVAVDRDGPAVFGVDLAERGRPERVPAMDLSQPVAWLELDDVAARRLGGADEATRLLDRGATLSTVALLGSAQRALDLAVEYAKERVQFDRPIGSFQAVKHRCADMLVDVEGIRSAGYWAAWCVAADDPQRSIAASTAKTWAGDASKRVMASALQVHGGIGFTWEHDLHLFMKRAQLDQVSFGDSTFHRARLASLLQARVLAGESVV